MVKNLLSVVLATRNEENNIRRCLDSVKKLFADLPAQSGEIVIVDEESTDKTREIAKYYGAKVYMVRHEPIFHITKQKSLDYAHGEWILQLDADEVVTSRLADELKKVIQMTGRQRSLYRQEIIEKYPLFKRHEQVVINRDGKIGKDDGEIVAFFIPRLNMFLGKPLVYAGVYPDPAIRLIKKGKAWFPAKSVHEIMEIDGKVGWLVNYMEHHDSPTLKRYFDRLNRYTDLHAKQLLERKVPKNFLFLIYYSLFKPTIVFFGLYLRHKGFLDGVRGFLWSFFSASHYPISYFKYLRDLDVKD